MNVRSLITNVVPALGGLLGSPLTGAVLKIASEVIYPEDENKTVTEKDIASIIKSGDIDKIIKLKEAEAKAVELANTLEYKTQELDIQDRNSARTMASKSGMLPQIAFSIAIFVMYTLMAYWAINHLANLKDANQLVLGSILTMLGGITAALPQILNFWFGGNKSSDDKDSAGNEIQQMLVNHLGNSKPK